MDLASYLPFLENKDSIHLLIKRLNPVKPQRKLWFYQEAVNWLGGDHTLPRKRMKSTQLFPNPITRGQLIPSGELKRRYRQWIPPFSSLTRVRHELSKNIYLTKLTLIVLLWNLNDSRSQSQVCLCWSKNGVFGGPAREAWLNNMESTRNT